MKSKYLFPTWGSWVGYLLAVPGFILGYLNIFKNYQIAGFGLRLREKDKLFLPAVENFTNELAIFLVIIGLLLIAFSRSRQEDELNAKLRLNSLYWGVMAYYLIYFAWLCANVAIGEIPFVGDHISELNLFTPLLIFIARFYYLKYVKKESYRAGNPRFLPHMPFKPIGVVLALLCLAALIAMAVAENLLERNDSLIQLLYIGLMIGLLLWAFSKNKMEDEMTMQQRLESLQLAVYMNYGIVLLATLLIYSLGFSFFLMYAQFSLLLYFVLRMEYVNFKNNRLLKATDGGLSYEK